MGVLGRRPRGSPRYSRRPASPLASLRTQLEEAQLHGEEQWREHLPDLLDDIRRLSRLVDDLLRLARVDALRTHEPDRGQDTLLSPNRGRTMNQLRNHRPQVVLEGTRLTHKMDLAYALQKHPRVGGPSIPLPLPTRVGGVGHADGRALGAEPGLVRAGERRRRAPATTPGWPCSGPHRFHPWFVDRFYLSTQVHQAGRGTPVDLGDVDAALADLGFCVVHCVRRPDTFPAAREARLLVSGNPSQYDNLDVSVAEQEAMAQAVARSRLPSLTLDVSDGDLAGFADRVADWLRGERLLGPSGSAELGHAGGKGAGDVRHPRNAACPRRGRRRAPTPTLRQPGGGTFDGDRSWHEFEPTKRW